MIYIETPEDEKTNKVPENSSNHTSVVTVSNEICFVKSCASISKHSDYESKSDDETYFDCTDQTPVSMVFDTYNWLTKDANAKDLGLYERQDSKLKEHEDTSEQDNNSDSDFLYFDKENKTRLFDIIEGKDADKYDTISDLQNLEKSHCTIGYALDLTDTLDKDYLAKYIDTKANNEIHSKNSKANTDDKKEVVDMQGKEQVAHLIDMDAKEAVDDSPNDRESENAADESPENEHDVKDKNAISEKQEKDDERAADKILRKTENIFDEYCDKLQEEDKIVCQVLLSIQDKDDDYGDRMVVGEIPLEANAREGEISQNDDEIDCKSGAAKEKECKNEIVDGMKAVDDETNDIKAVRELQNIETKEKHGDIDGIKEVWEFEKLYGEKIGRIQRLTDEIDAEEVDRKIATIMDGEDVDGGNIEKTAAFNDKQAVEILKADADIYDKNSTKNDDIVLTKAIDEVETRNFKHEKVSNKFGDNKEEFSSTDEEIKGLPEMTSKSMVCLKDNTFHHLEGCSTQNFQKTWFSTRNWKLVEALMIVMCIIPYSRGANNTVSSEVSWSLQTNPVVFGSNATLCCIMESPAINHMAWLLRDGPDAMIVATGDSPSNPMKYSASVEPKGNITYYMLTIINVDMTDVNVNYKCESDFDLFEQNLELSEDIFVMKPSSKETVMNITRENGMIRVSLWMRNMYPKPECYFSSKKENINGNVSLEENGKLYNVKMAYGISEDMCEDNVTVYCALGKEMVYIDLPTSNNSWTQRCSKDINGNHSVLIVTVLVIITLVFIVILWLFVNKYLPRKVSYAFQQVLKSEQPVCVDV